MDKKFDAITFISKLLPCLLKKLIKNKKKKLCIEMQSISVLNKNFGFMLKKDCYQRKLECVT